MLLLVVTLGLIACWVVFADSCRLLFCISFIVFAAVVTFVICCFRGLRPIAGLVRLIVLIVIVLCVLLVWLLCVYLF